VLVASVDAVTKAPRSLILNVSVGG
jgi:hypothetical protein